MDKFLTHVEAICNKVDNNIHYLNCGGCAVFASLMGQCLEKYGRVAIAVASDESEVSSLDEVRINIDPNSLDEWTDNGVYFTHVIVEFTYGGAKYHIDSTGVHKKSGTTYIGNWSILKGRLTVSETTSLASHTNWNWRFNRTQIPKMKRMIDKGFQHMFNEGLKPTIA